MTRSDLPLVLMTVVAPIGAFDILYFHLWRFRLYDAPTARGETVTHLVRGAVFAGVAGLLTWHQPQGAWFWFVAALVGFDFVNNIVDVLLEGPSRAPMGGLPRLEYLVHVVGATATGAVSVAFLITAWSGRLMPTALAPATHPPWLMWQGSLLAVGGAAMFGLELLLFTRSVIRSGWSRGRREAATPAPS